MFKKVLITGASGFIGTNIVEEFLKKEYMILNIDKQKPKIKEHEQFWKQIDILDFDLLRNEIHLFQPDYIIHLAARTDLNGKYVSEYSSNTAGTENILKIIHEIPKLKKIIITSSKFVCPNGYTPVDQFDYSPHTVYGESKVMTEKIVWANKPQCDWCIIRPTSIWGAWFGIPYRNFFDMVMHRLYFHIGHLKCYKTYGYIGNSVYQIEQLLLTDTLNLENKVFYIGDEPSYELNEWANEIANELGFKVPTLPVWCAKILAKFGDLLGIFNINFPLQSFRFENMTKDGINDMTNTLRIAPCKKYTRLEGTKATIDWIRKYES